MNVTRKHVFTDDELRTLVAKVLAWVEAEPLDSLDQAASHSSYQDSAQQCCEDLGLA